MSEYLIKRIYEEPDTNDGFRVLIDRLWPRGVSKEKAALDLWLKDIAPSSELRKWFDHKPEKLKEFTIRYQHELDNNPAVKTLKELAGEHGKITLLYAAKDPVINHARVLKQYLEDS